MKESENHPRSLHSEITTMPLWSLRSDFFFFSMCKPTHVKEWYCLLVLLADLLFITSHLLIESSCQEIQVHIMILPDAVDVLYFI